jgi:hypothetical protein
MIAHKYLNLQSSHLPFLFCCLQFIEPSINADN